MDRVATAFEEQCERPHGLEKMRTDKSLKNADLMAPFKRKYPHYFDAKLQLSKLQAEKKSALKFAGSTNAKQVYEALQAEKADKLSFYFKE